jgi:hypothetical protein
MTEPAVGVHEHPSRKLGKRQPKVAAAVPADARLKIEQ